jgi:cell division protein FtsQ
MRGKNRRRLSPEEQRQRRARALRVVLRGSALALGVSGAAALAFGVVSAGWHALLQAPALALSRVEVVGNQRVSADEVRQNSGLALGANLFRIDLGRAAQALAENPWIRSVSLRRHWPDSVVIAIEERRAGAAVDLGGRLYLADDRGEVFKRASPQDGLDLPLLTGLSRTRFIADRAGVQQQILTSLTLLSDLDPTALREASEVHWDEDLGVTLYLGPDAVAVHLGESDFEGKLERYARARSELDRRHLKVSSISLDDRVHPERVSVTLAGSEHTLFH